ncbi:MAG: trigger factor [Propionibacteriales bacterium]|nr:trigger factor [Propionibacteriales bacterium]
MQSAVEELSPTSVRLTVEVPFEELKPSLDAAYKKIAGQITVPGFRKGRVPPQIIDQRLGRGVVLDEAVNDAIPRYYTEALRENDLTPLGQPELDVKEFEDGEKLTFTAELDVRPHIELPEYNGVTAEVDGIEIADAEVEEQLQALRERFGTLTEVDRSAADGDFVTIDLAATKDGEPIEDAQAAGLSYQIGSGNMLDGLDEALTGMTAGKENTFTSTLVGGELVGEEVQVQVTLQAVKEQQLPDVDEEFAQMASEFDTVEELTADLRDRLLRGKRLEQAAAARDAVLEKLLDLTEVPLPERVVADEVESRREQIRQQLAYAGMTEQQYLDSEQQTEDEFSGELEKRATDALAAQFVLEEIAKKEELGVEESELTEHIQRRAQGVGMQPAEYADQMMKAGQVPALVSEVVRGKALALVVESAEVTDGSGDRVDLKNLRPDGTYGEPEAQTEAQVEPAAEPAGQPEEQAEEQAEPGSEDEPKDA